MHKPIKNYILYSSSLKTVLVSTSVLNNISPHWHFPIHTMTLYDLLHSLTQRPYPLPASPFIFLYHPVPAPFRHSAYLYRHCAPIKAKSHQLLWAIPKDRYQAFTPSFLTDRSSVPTTECIHVIEAGRKTRQAFSITSRIHMINRVKDWKQGWLWWDATIWIKQSSQSPWCNELLPNHMLRYAWSLPGWSHREKMSMITQCRFSFI